MNFEANDLKKLLPGLTAAIALTASGAGLVYWMVQASAQAELEFQRGDARFVEAERRMREVNREEEEIRASSARYQALAKRGIIGAEQRLEWVELIADIRKNRRLFDIDYEFAPQQVLPGSSPPFQFSVSSMTFRLPLLHEGDLFRLIEDLQARAPAHVQPRACTIEKISGTGNSNLSPHLNSSCTLHWITIQDEQQARARS